MHKKIKVLLLTALATSSLGWDVVIAQTQSVKLPAVSNMNGWIGAFAGDTSVNDTTNQKNNGGALIVGEGGFAAPLGDHFGFQLNGWDGVVSHNNYQSVEGFVFWRNPCQGLLGPHIAYINVRHLYLTMYGLYGEAYLNDWTISLDASEVSKNNASNTYFAQAFIHWYSNPNLRFGTGYGRMKDNGALVIDAEYMPGSLSSFPGLSLFAEIGAGNQELRFGFLGLRYYFGSDPIPLINRHREDMVPPQFNLIMNEQS